MKILYYLRRPLKHAAPYFALLIVAMASVLTSCSDDESEAAVPSITSFAPAEGLVGTEVTISGANLKSVISLFFGETKATIISRSTSGIVAKVPSGAATGKLKVTYTAGHVLSANDFVVTFKKVNVSDFEEDNVSTVWGVSEDAGEILVSAFEEVNGNTFYHLKGADTNGNYWLGGRYKNTGNPATPLGVTETDAAKVFFNVDVKSNASIGSSAPMAKLVFYSYDATSDTKKKNWEIDFPVIWTEWKTISISADNFHRWNGSGFSDFSGQIETVSEVALYLTGGSSAVYDFSFDNVIFSEGTALGQIITP